MSDTPNSRRVRHPGKSRIVGPARQADGTTTTAYRAVAPHVCGQCGAEIAPDALFSRHARPQMAYYSTGLSRVPMCVRCRPLQVEGEG